MNLASCSSGDMINNNLFSRQNNKPISEIFPWKYISTSYKPFDYWVEIRDLYRKSSKIEHSQQSLMTSKRAQWEISVIICLQFQIDNAYLNLGDNFSIWKEPVLISDSSYFSIIHFKQFPTSYPLKTKYFSILQLRIFFSA